jgi:predicted MPP superfamily phosphohydrolase
MARRVAGPLDRLIRRVPWPELGLARPVVTRIAAKHRSLHGRRAVHLSDLHLDHYRPRHDAVVEMIGTLRPDWIFITGDLLSTRRGVPAVFRFMAGLREIAPVYLTLGNHDHESKVPVSRFKEMADRHRINLLVNQVQIVRIGRGAAAGELGIVGLDDPVTHRADVRCIPRATAGRFTLLLAHAPNVLELLHESHAADLILCGHSHGGQWRLPRRRPLWLPYGCRGRAEGHIRHNGRWMYVNRGLGWTFVPIRVNCPPEIVVIEWT